MYCRELESKVGPAVEIFFSSSCVYLCQYEVLEASLLRGADSVDAPCSFPMDTG